MKVTTRVTMSSPSQTRLLSAQTKHKSAIEVMKIYCRLVWINPRRSLQQIEPSPIQSLIINTTSIRALPITTHTGITKGGLESSIDTIDAEITILLKMIRKVIHQGCSKKMSKMALKKATMKIRTTKSLNKAWINLTNQRLTLSHRLRCQSTPSTTLSSVILTTRQT